jgi:hypothetical protein
MKTDIKGCSTCETGQENYSEFKNRNLKYIQYDYRHTTGELFSCVASTIEKCREKRDNWLKSLNS